MSLAKNEILTMNKLVHYLITLSPNDYRKLLTHYLPPTYIDDSLINQFISEIYYDAAMMEIEVFIDPHTWLEEKVEDFCTPDIESGYQFSLSY